MHSKISLPTKYKISKISEVTKDQLSDFYKKTYYSRYKSLTSNWHWWYRVGYNEFEPLIVSIDNKVIGQAAYLPTDLNISGNKVPDVVYPRAYRCIGINEFCIAYQTKQRWLGGSY